MKIISNRGKDRAIAQIESVAGPVDASAISSSVSIFGLSALQDVLPRDLPLRLLLSTDTVISENLLGGGSDRFLRNNLTTRQLAREAARWISSAQVRIAQTRVPQSAFMLRNSDGAPSLAMVGACSLTTSGLGVTPADPFSLLQTAETSAELTTLASWFEEQWRTLGDKPDGRHDFLRRLTQVAGRRSASEVHLRILDALFNEMGEA